MKFTIEISQEDILAIISRANGGNQNVVAEVTSTGEVQVKAENRGRPAGSKNKPAAPEPEPAKPVVQAAAPKPSEPAKPAASAPSEPAKYTLQDISKALTEKAQKSGDREGVLAILRKYAPTVSQVKPEQYAALMADLSAPASEPAAEGDSW